MSNEVSAIDGGSRPKFDANPENLTWPPTWNNYEDETFIQKVKRKIKGDPYVPAGCMLTAGILMGGLRSFSKGASQSGRSQQWMRARVMMQAITVGFFLVGGGYSSYASSKLQIKESENKGY